MNQRGTSHHRPLHLDANSTQPVPAHRPRRRSRTETVQQSPHHDHDRLSASSLLLPVPNSSTPYRSTNATPISHIEEETPPMSPALKLARQAPKAGYLNKLGGNVRQFKRRFFVLQPTTTLYYFLSPDDDEPRGCLDLEGATILPRFRDSVYQFVIQLPNDTTPIEVVLEARSETEANDWIRALTIERIDVVKSQLHRSQLAISAYKSRVAELEQSLEDCKHVEADRDGALEDAANWKRQFEALEEAIRHYSNYLRNEIMGSGETQASGLDPAQAPGIHFATLWNTVEQIRANLVLASKETNTALEDVKVANATVKSLEKRMGQAETHLCKIWEENCELRKVIQQYKREKRVLVKEVKSLREQQQQQHSMEESVMEEQQLLDDIEAHVRNSIQLQQELVGVPKVPDDLNRSADSDDSDHNMVGATLGMSCGPTTIHETACGPRLPESAVNRPMGSLLDNDDENESDASSVSTDSTHPARDRFKSDTAAPLHSDPEAIGSQSADEDYSERSNPLGKLDDVDLHDELPPKLIALSSSSSTVHSRQPTSHLACPLADVVSSTKEVCKTTDGEVYHLTFYSRKIGLQFQKVPPPPALPMGLLTEAMTADLARVASASEKTAAELRRIAKISGTAKTDQSNEMACQVAKPIDAVLVCGFVGFDDSSGNEKPKLGARLVAFDGVSLEAGEWTFQSVRKAIQARRRPLTLSFRNDFLTTAQRKILTKAVKDMENISPTVERIPSGSNFKPEELSKTSQTSLMKDDEMSSATESSAGLGHHSESSAASFSKFRSFSEAGSTVSVLSAVGPLVSNLLAKKKEPFTPQYLRRPSVSVDQSPHHLDFKADLL